MDNTSVKTIIERLADGYWQNDTYWPYQMEIKSWYDIGNAERFCYTNFKSKNWRNVTRYFAFKRKQDYEWFLLRWQ